MRGEVTPHAALGMPAPRVERRITSEGDIVLRSELELGRYATNVGEWLTARATNDPDRVFLAQRDLSGDGWAQLSFRVAHTRACAVSQALLDRGLGPERPVMILSGASLDHGVLSLACQLVGVPVVPVSVAYSLLSDDHVKVRAIHDEVTPGLVFAEDGAAFADALSAVSDGGAELVVGAGEPEGLTTTAFRTLAATTVTDDVGRAAASVGPDTVAKILYTSGSTGRPKGVVNTHRMLCANMQQLRQVWPFLEDTPPVLLDWMPWNHTFGGNHDTNMVLRFGGSLYIDDGRPTPDRIGRTVRNLRSVHPTIALNVPAGYGALLPFLESDDGLAAGFFERLQVIFYAAAALPQDLWDRLQRLIDRFADHPVVMTSAWGATETAPMATSAHFPLERAGNLGVPVPGVELKLVDAGDTLEVRVRGPNVTPGYHRRPELTAEAFDHDGFYRIGDAVRLADPDDPSAGLLFDGRVAEDFKLSTGTKVPVGKLRVDLIAALSPLVTDAVITGHDRDHVGALVWLHDAELARTVGAGHDDSRPLADDPAVRDALRERLAAYNARQRGSSTIVHGLVVLTDPPSFDAGEITDKGYINQRATLRRRAGDVAKLDADPPDDSVIGAER
ncbi:MAG TPA: feruloyl-CoA synthase [Euzebyales bacterium]